MATIAPGSPAAGLLASALLGWLTTVRADGQPQSSYVWFHFDGTDLLIATEPGAAKLRNLRANPLVSFHLDGDGQGGRVVTLDGRAEVVDTVAPAREEAFLAKYDQISRDRFGGPASGLRAQFSATVLVTPTRVRAW